MTPTPNNPEHLDATGAVHIDVVLGALGHDTTDYTIPYVTGWAGGDLDKIRATAAAVTTHAHHILDQLQPADDTAESASDSRHQQASSTTGDDRLPARDDPGTGPADGRGTTEAAGGVSEPDQPGSTMPAVPAAEPHTVHPDVNDTTPERAGLLPLGTTEKITKTATRGPNTPQSEQDEEHRAYVEAGARGLYATELAAGDNEPNHAVIAQLGQLRGGGYLHPSTVYAITAHEHAPEQKTDSADAAIRRGRRALDQLTHLPDDVPDPRPGSRTAEPSRDLGSEPTIDD